MKKNKKKPKDEFAHLTAQQKARIREVAIQVYAAGDGCDNVPGEEAAKAYVEGLDLGLCLALFEQVAQDYLDFDHWTGQPWGE